MLVQVFPRARIGRHVFEYGVILLEHRPVQSFKPVTVEKAPYIALPALHLAAAPEENLRVLGVDRRHETDDEKRTARAVLFLVGNGKAHPLRSRLAPFHP